MIQDYLQKKIEESYDVLKVAAEISKEYYGKPLIVTYSGGKDSDVLLQLALECLNPDDFEVINNHTTVDAPETVYYIRKTFKRLEGLGVKATVQYPHYKDGRFKSMWTLIEDNMMPPTRLARYCCRELKETTMPHTFRATGVREAESVGRKGREVFTVRAASKKDAQHFSLSHIKEVFEDDKTRRKEDGVNSDLDSGYNAIVSNGEIVKIEDLLLPSGSHFVKETFSKYKPGEHYEYANFGSGIQACIIERLTGMKFTKYVRDKVLLPLGLDASFDIRDILCYFVGCVFCGVWEYLRYRK